MIVYFYKHLLNFYVNDLRNLKFEKAVVLETFLQKE